MVISDLRIIGDIRDLHDDDAPAAASLIGLGDCPHLPFCLSISGLRGRRRSLRSLGLGLLAGWRQRRRAREQP